MFPRVNMLLSFQKRRVCWNVCSYPGRSLKNGKTWRGQSEGPGAPAYISCTQPNDVTHVRPVNHSHAGF